MHTHEDCTDNNAGGTINKAAYLHDDSQLVVNSVYVSNNRSPLGPVIIYYRQK